jgi:hypothetical protein
MSAEAAERMRAKQFAPCPSRHTVPAAARAYVPAGPLLEAEAVARSVGKANNNAAGGPSGWRNSYIKALFTDEELGAEIVISVLERVVRGEFGALVSDPSRRLPLINVASLVALKCDPAGVKLRPLAIGECWRRLGASCLVRSRRDRVEAVHLRAHNTAASRSGCEVGQRTIALLMQEHPEFLCAETDLSDAYQHASREEMLVQLFASDELHDFLPIFYSLYDGDAELFFGDICSVFSEEGSHQGCPLGGFLFLLSIVEAVETVISEFPSVTVVGLADDYRFVGPALDVLAAAARYAELVKGPGHVFCVRKSKVWSPSVETLRLVACHPFVLGCPARREGMQVVPADQGLIVLGAPLGDPAWCAAQVEQQVRDMRPRFDALVRLASCEHPGAAQAAFTLLRYCVSTSARHLLRCVAPAVMEAAAVQMDTMIRECLSSLLSERRRPLHELPDDEDEDDFGNESRIWAWGQATLPTAQGGLGLGSMSIVSPAAYLASHCDYLAFMNKAPASLFRAVRPLVRRSGMRRMDLPVVRAVHAAWDQLCDFLDGPEERGCDHLKLILGEHVCTAADLTLARAGAQGAITHALWRALDFRLREDASLEDCVRLTACGGSEAGWVTQAPTRPEYRLTSAQWRTSMCTRLGVGLEFLADGPIGCDCHASHARSVRRDVARTADGNPPKRRLKKPPPVDVRGEHDRRCRYAFKLPQHNTVQAVTERKIRRGGKHVRKASVEEMRASCADRSQKQADLVSDNLAACGTPTLIDVGLTHSILDTHLSNKSKTVRGKASNTMGNDKRRGYEREIQAKSLNYLYRSFTCETFGAFGSEAWKLINQVCDRDHPHARDDSNVWRRPDPKKDFVLSVAFAIQRGCSSTLLRAASRRRSRQAAAVVDPEAHSNYYSTDA